MFNDPRPYFCYYGLTRRILLPQFASIRVISARISVVGFLFASIKNMTGILGKLTFALFICITYIPHQN